MKLVKDTDQITKKDKQVSDEKAQEAVKTIIQWIGENPDREGLKSTPKRVIKAFIELIPTPLIALNANLIDLFLFSSSIENMELDRFMSGFLKTIFNLLNSFLSKINLSVRSIE